MICERDLNWEKDLCRCSKINDLKVSATWITQMALNSTTGILIREMQREI